MDAEQSHTTWRLEIHITSSFQMNVDLCNNLWQLQLSDVLQTYSKVRPGNPSDKVKKSNITVSSNISLTMVAEQSHAIWRFSRNSLFAYI